MTRDYIVEFFKEFCHKTTGIEGWLHDSAPENKVFDRLVHIDREPLTKVQLDQLFLLSLESGISDDFFEYYWLTLPRHSYSVDMIEDYNADFIGKTSIISLEHLRWGLRRIYVDGLLYFGSVKNGFKELRSKSSIQLNDFFRSKTVPTEIIKKRGSPLEFIEITKDDRYLISEMACKSYGETPKTKNELMDFLKESYKEAVSNNKKRITFKELLSVEKDESGGPKKNAAYINKKSREKFKGSLSLFEFSTDELLETTIENEQELLEKYGTVAEKFIRARKSALENTDLYLSLVNDLDVYVATSMRSRKDFRDMADTCEKIFKDNRLKDLDLRYFDPTISAADGHEDKGLIECLMVKCAKVLVYCAGDKESYGKDAEAAMALSLGKPVIFFCNPQTRADFYKSVHPLSRLIDFNTGVAVGAIVTEKIDEVSELLSRIFENKMEYAFEQTKPGYYRLIEKITRSVIRVQTNFELLSKSFWTYYHTRHEVS